MKSKFKKLMDDMDVILQKRTEGCLPTKKLLKVLNDEFKAFHKKHGEYLENSKNGLIALKDFLDSHKEFRLENHDFGLYQSFSADASKSVKGLEIDLEVEKNDAFNPRGKLSLALTISHDWDEPEYRYEDKDFKPECYTKQKNLEPLAGGLRKSGFGTEHVVKAIGELLESAMGDLHLHMDSLHALMEKRAGRALDGDITKNLFAIMHSSKEKPRETDKLLSLCMTEVKNLGKKLKFVGEAILLLEKAQDILGECDCPVSPNYGNGAVYSENWYGSRLSVYIRVEKPHGNAKPKSSITIGSNMTSYDDEAEWSAPLEKAGELILNAINNPRFNEAEREALPALFKDVVADIINAAENIHDDIEEMIEKEKEKYL